MEFMFWLGLALLGATATAGAEGMSTNRLSLEECVRLALEHNYDLQIERLNPEIARYGLAEAGAAFEPVFNVNGGEQFVTVPGGVDPKKAGLDAPYELTTDGVGTGVYGVLPTGLQYGIQAAGNRLSAVTDFSTPFVTFLRYTNQYTAEAALTLRQPLLRDMWTDRYRQAIALNRKNLKISEQSLRWRMMNTVNAVQQAYYELIFAREKVRIEEHALALAERLLVGTRRRVEVGDTSPLDAEQAAAQVESIRTSVYSSQQSLSKQQNALKQLLTDDFPGWADRSIEPADELTRVPDTSDRSESWHHAIDHRPDLAEVRLDLEKQGINVRYRFNQLFPSLDLVGGYGLRSQENSGESTLADIRDRSKPGYSFGAVLSIPLGGNQAARNRYKAGQAAKQQAVLRLKKLQQDVLMQVDDSITAVRFAFKRTESARKARHYAEAALDAEQKKLKDGITTTFLVLQFQQKLEAAQMDEIRALADYHEAQAQLALHDGSTLEKNRLQVDLK